MTQLNLFDGEHNKRAGMQRGLDHANAVDENWGNKALQFTRLYLNNLKPDDKFMCEDVRVASAGVVPEPPDKRVWGPIMSRAAKCGLIHSAGKGHLKNPKANRGNAEIWQKN